MLRATFTLMLIMMTTQGCNMQQIEHYQNNEPTLRIQDYLKGDSKAWGLIKDWRGKVTRRFEVSIHGDWDGNKGIIKETFIYDDDETQNREWRVNIQDDHHFTATADDVNGIAHGEQFGNTIHLNYSLQIPYKDSTMNLTIDDWLYAINDTTVINQSRLKKFGLPVGSLFIAFQKGS